MSDRERRRRSRSRSPRDSHKYGSERSRVADRYGDQQRDSDRHRESYRRRDRDQRKYRSRSRSIERARDRSRERERDTDRRTRKHHRGRSQSRSPKRRRSSVSSSSSRRRSRDREDRGDDKYSDHPQSSNDGDEEIDAMQSLMGFSNFKTTKGKHVHGNSGTTIAKVQRPKHYRQYMNRRGGFNRPLDPIH